MPLDELATRLSVATAEVEGIERRGVADAGGNLDLFSVGRVLEAVKHPNADRLQLTKVDVGEGEPRSIVCGAWNFGVGATVGVALPGAVLPNGLTLERREVRGEVSDGMILAEDEVGLGTDHAGIMLLPETEPGTPLADVLPLADAVLLVESTGNRPDLQSIYGIAREIAALYDLPLADVPGRAARRHASRRRRWRSAIDDFDGLPALHRAAVRGRDDRAVADVAARAAHAAGHAPDLERRRHHELRDARARQPAARVRLHDARTAAGSSSAARRRARSCARSTASTASSCPTTCVIADAERRGRARRDHGRRGDRDRRRRRRPSCSRPRTSSRHGIYRSSERHRLRTEGVEPLGEGRRPVPRRARRRPRDRADARARGRRAGRRQPTSTPACPSAPVIALPPRARRRADRRRDAARATSTRCSAGSASSAGRRATSSSRPGARATSRARSTSSRRSRASGSRTCPFTLPARREMFGRAHARAAAAPPARGRARRPRLRRDLHAEPRPDDDTTVEAARADLGRADRAADDADPEPRRGRAAQRRRGRAPRSRCSRSRASTSPAASCPTSASASPGIAEGGFLRVKGVVETLYAALKAEPAFERAEHPLLHPGKTARTPAGVARRAAPAAARGRVGRVRARPRRAVRRRRTSRSPTRT